MSNFTTLRWSLEGDGASDSDCTPGANENKPATLETPVSTTDISATISIAPGLRSIFSWTTPAGEPDVSDWPNDSYKASVRVTAVPSGCLGRLLILRVNSGCSVLDTNADTGFFDHTGLPKTHSFTFSANPAAGSAGDRYQLIVEVLYTVGSSGLLTVDVSHADSYLEGPFDTEPPYLETYIARRALSPLIRR